MYFIATQFNNASDGPAAAEEGHDSVKLRLVGHVHGIYEYGKNCLMRALDEKQKYLARQRKITGCLALQSGMLYTHHGA